MKKNESTIFPAVIAPEIMAHLCFKNMRMQFLPVHKIISTIIFCCLLGTTTAQYCGNSGPSVCTPTVLASTGFSPTADSIPSIVAGLPTTIVIEFQNFDTLTLAGQTFTIQSLTFDSIENLPAGLCWATNSTTNTYSNGQNGCIKITGTTNAAPGQYKLRFIGTFNVGFQLEIPFDAIGWFYYLRVNCSDTFAARPVDTTGESEGTLPSFSPYNCTGAPLSVSLGANKALHCKSNVSLSGAVSGGQAPYTYSWSYSGDSLSCENCANANAVITQNSTYTITVTDYSNLTASAIVNYTLATFLTANVGSNQTLAGCGTDTLGGNPTASGGTSPYTYQWSPNSGLYYNGYANPVVRNIYTPTTYTLIVTDSVGCKDTGRVTITPVLTTAFTPPVATISGCELSCQIDSNFTYQWYHGVFPISGATAPTYSEDSAGGWYAVITSTIYPLCHVPSNSLYVNPYQNQEICIVTLDSTNTYNLVVWGNTTGLDIAKFRIYKQSDSTSQYVLLGEQPYDQFSTYLDTTSKPSQAIASYKISIVDSCNNESGLSSTHTTILLSSNLGINNTVNLSWNAYQGFTYSNFEIWRSANGGPMTLLTTVANTTLAYVDNSPPTQAYYQIEVTNPNGCNPARSAFDYSTVRSNIVNNTTTAIQSLNEQVQGIILFPNPSNGIVNVGLKGDYIGSAELRVIDELGRIVIKQPVEIKAGSNNFNISLTVAGTYYMEVATSKGNIGKGVIIIE